MSSQKVAKPASRWNFLQQAVASVESGLDKILADEEDAKKASTHQTPKVASQTPRASSELTRPENASRTNDRLQGRLAQAMARKGSSKPETPVPSPPLTSRVSTPVPSVHAAESSPTDQEKANRDFEQTLQTEGDESDADRADVVVEAVSGGKKESSNSMAAAEESDVTGVQSTHPSPNNAPEDLEAVVATPEIARAQPAPTAEAITSADVEKVVAEVPEIESAEQSSLQEEMNAYIEKIDALQAKLLYLTQEAANSARQAAVSAQAGSAEKRIIEKDEKIALLMQEGEKLSKTEMKHLTTIKKLRTHATTIQKEQEAARTRAEKAEANLRAVEERARKAEAAAKRTEETLTAQTSARKDYDAILHERDALDATLVEIKSQLARAHARAEAAEAKANSGQLERERKRVTDLEDDLKSSRDERKNAEEVMSREIKDLKAALQKEKDQARAMETEMLGEQASLESKLESFRSRAEAAYSTDQGDSQAKLLRQIETLQSQYSAATQNWQTVEGTLLARITNLEKERNDVVGRESDLRKKLKDTQIKVRNNERELQDMQDRYSESQRSQTSAEDELQRLIRQHQQLKDELIVVEKEAEDQKHQAGREFQKRIEEEKAKWMASTHVLRNESPVPPLLLTSRKGSTLDLGHLLSPVHSERPHSRKSSAMHFVDPGTPTRQSTAASSSYKGIAFTNGAIPETPSIVTSTEHDDYFNTMSPTRASHAHTMSNQGLNDLISTSTVGAGPSVQLVERMSANVRRLESEKAASKDEIARLSTQRDEARQEVVNLMREVEQKRTAEERLKALEKDHADLRQRHQTTLEILGEKSEQVDELKADILDVKQMYRELADHMGQT